MKLILLVIGHFVFGIIMASCSPKMPKSTDVASPCPPQESIQDSLGLQICLDCKSPAQSDSFETSLGSVLIPLSDFQFQASIQHTWRAGYKPTAQDLKPVNEGRHMDDYMIYERRSLPHQPRIIVAYGFFEGQISWIYQKYFYRDTVLESGLAFGKENPMPTDTCSFHAVRRKLWSEIDALKVIPQVEYDAGYHQEYYNSYGYVFSKVDQPGDYYRGEIPYPDQFRYYLWLSGLLLNQKPGQIASIELRTELSLTDVFYSTHKDGLNGYRDYYEYQTGPEDLSLRLIVRYHY
jgi:hypothetical protein